MDGEYYVSSTNLREDGVVMRHMHAYRDYED